MIVAIHQPNYLPWLGYFYKIYACDVFVFHDAVEFSKASFTKRCKIRREKSSAETIWLSVPVRQHHSGTMISDIEISDDQNWIVRHLNKIDNTYRSAPYFDAHFEWLRQVMLQAQSESTLAAYNARLIREFAKLLGIDANFWNSSDMPVSGKGNEYNLAIAKHLGATAYLAGIGSKNYQDNLTFEEAGIKTIQHDIGTWLNAHPYDQGTGAFTGGLSIVDALLHVGSEGIKEIFVNFQQSLHD